MNLQQIYVFGILWVMYADALLCFSKKVRYNYTFSILCAVLWPITVPVLIIGTAILNRNFPKIGDEDE